MSDKVEKNKASVIITDPTVLGDRLPRDKDSIAQKIEQTKNERQARSKGDFQDLLANKDMAAVNTLRPFDFIRRLQKLNEGLLFGVGMPGCVSVWVMALDDIPDSPTFQQLVPTAIACGFRIDGPLNEWSSLDVDKWGVATREGDNGKDRGWRTVLIRLIKGGFLKYQAVKAEFGEPTGPRADYWNMQMREYKQ